MAVQGGAEAVEEGDGAEPRAERRAGGGVRHGHRGAEPPLDVVEEDPRQGGDGPGPVGEDAPQSLRQRDTCSAEQFVDRLDEPRNVDVHRIPQDAMVDQVVAVDEVISRARDVLPRNIIPSLLEFARKTSYSLANNFDASLQCRRRLSVRQKGIKRVRSTQCPGLFGRVANLRECDSRVTTAHESS